MTQVRHTYDEWPLRDVVNRIESGLIGLPDFQRRFDWSANDVKALLATALAGLPSGTLLIAPNSSLNVGLHPLEDAPHLTTSNEKLTVLLDGQQRVTALYQAVANRGMHQFGLDIEALLAGADLLQDDVILARSRRRGTPWRRGRVIPIDVMYSSERFFHWLNGEELEAGTAKQLGEIFGTQVRPLADYRLAVLSLEAEVDLSTAAQIFERLNKWGQPLDTFDLLVARLKGDGFGLRSRWEQLITEDPTVGHLFGQKSLLPVSALSLVRHRNVRRSAVLQLGAKDLEPAWSGLRDATSRAAALLQEFGVAAADLLPYDAVAVGLIAVLMQRPTIDPNHLRRYFWLTSASGRYESASNTRVVEDVASLLSDDQQLRGRFSLPEIDEVAIVTRRSNRALWSTLVCSLLSSRPYDLVTGEPIAPSAQNGWDYDLVPFTKGGTDTESVRATPIRLRAVGQIAALRTSAPAMRRRGLTRVVTDGLDEPRLIGASIDQALRSQHLPSPDAIIDGGVDPSTVASDRAAELLARIAAATV